MTIALFACPEFRIQIFRRWRKHEFGMSEHKVQEILKNLQLFCARFSNQLSIPAPIEPPVRSLRAAIPATQSHYSGGGNHHSGN